MSADAPILGGELAGASFIASDKSENYSGVTISYYTDAYENYLAVRKWIIFTGSVPTSQEFW